MEVLIIACALQVSTARVLGADGQPSWRDMFNTLVKGVEEQMGKLKALAAARKQEVAIVSVETQRDMIDRLSTIDNDESQFIL